MSTDRNNFLSSSLFNFCFVDSSSLPDKHLGSDLMSSCEIKILFSNEVFSKIMLREVILFHYHHQGR